MFVLLYKDVVSIYSGALLCVCSVYLINGFVLLVLCLVCGSSLTTKVATHVAVLLYSP